MVPMATLEEEPSGVSQPLLQMACATIMEVVSAKPCQLRAEFELTSDKAGEVAGGTVVYVIEQRQTADGAMRMSIVPEGQTSSIGWLTGITKDGKKNVQELGRPVLEVIAAKPLAARAAFELTSGKAGEVACKALIHVLEARATADGAFRVAYALEGSDATKGWVTGVTKDGTVNLQLVREFKAHRASGGGGGDSGGATASDATPAPTGSGAKAKDAAAKSAKGKGAADAAASSSAADESSGGPSDAASRLILTSRVPGSVISAKPTLVRAGVELTSDKVGELAPGSLVHIIEERENSDGSKRCCFSLEGEMGVYGWISSITSSGAQNLRTLPRPLVDVAAAKALQVCSIARAGRRLCAHSTHTQHTPHTHHTHTTHHTPHTTHHTPHTHTHTERERESTQHTAHARPTRTAYTHGLHARPTRTHFAHSR